MSENRKRNQTLTIRVTASEKDAITQKAAKARMSLTDCKGNLYKGNETTRLSFRVKRSETEESTDYITAKQSYRAKILRFAALTQDDSLFYRVIIPGLFAHFFLNETAPIVHLPIMVFRCIFFSPWAGKGRPKSLSPRRHR